MKNSKNYLNRYLLITKLVYRIIFGFKYGFKHTIFGKLCHIGGDTFCYYNGGDCCDLNVYKLYDVDGISRTKFLYKFYIKNKHIKHLISRRLNKTVIVHEKTKIRDSNFQKLFS